MRVGVLNGDNMSQVNDKPWVAVARVGMFVERVQLYFDGINDKKVVFQCGKMGNWVYDIDTNSLKPLLSEEVKDRKVVDGVVI